MMKSIYVIGSNSQLGSEIRSIFPYAVFLGRKDIDLSSNLEIENFFKNKDVDIIVNCAAYTHVDLAETEKELAYKINCLAPGILAKHSKKFIHFSTDYVFDGTENEPYKENHPTNPQNFYGKTKLAGEKSVLEANSESVIIRTSWLYSDFGKNFVKTMIRLGNEKSVLKVVSDQIGSPTSAADLAKLVINHGIKNWHFKGGIYHFSNEGEISWADFADEVMSILKLECKIIPIQTSEYPTLAKRPLYSVLDKSKIKNELGITIPNWKESLSKCLQKQS